MYQLLMLDLTQYIKRLADNTVIPMNPDNTDYQAYLKWVAEGNTPEPAEEGNTPDPADDGSLA
jgi:hypothetical protein